MITLTLTVGLLCGGSEAVERLVVKTAEPMKVEVDPYAAQVTISGASAEVARALKLAPSRICPTFDAGPKAVTLKCPSHRIEASVTGSAIDLKQLRGLPWRKDQGGPPLQPWAPEDVGLGGPCPGDRPAGKAECALAAGAVVDAKIALHDAVTGPDAPYAWVRTGDLALADGDLIGGIEAFKKAGDKGLWGRLARARLCELLGSCLEDAAAAKLFDPIALPAVLQRELLLRAARADALMGRLDVAVRSVLAMGPDGCAGAEPMCGQLLKAALADPAPATRGAALELWAAHQQRLTDVTVTIAAADAAASLGAKRFAADLRSSATPQVPPGALNDHLLKALGDYLDAGDAVRAGVIADFARSRLGDKALTSAAWRKALGALGPVKPAKSGPLGVGTAQAIATDCQRADAVLQVARKVGAEPESP